MTAAAGCASRGTVSVMTHLAAVLPGGDSASAAVLFLTPCHATPWRSHLHLPAPLRFLDWWATAFTVHIVPGLMC